jgi:hypothetical protein
MCQNFRKFLLLLLEWKNEKLINLLQKDEGNGKATTIAPNIRWEIGTTHDPIFFFSFLWLGKCGDYPIAKLVKLTLVAMITQKT